MRESDKGDIQMFYDVCIVLFAEKTKQFDLST